MSARGEGKGARIRRESPDGGMRKGGVGEELNGSGAWCRQGDYAGGKAQSEKEGERGGKQSSLLDGEQWGAGGEIKGSEEEKKQNWKRNRGPKDRGEVVRRNNPGGREEEDVVVSCCCCNEQVPGSSLG
jgi:hypothetical protein